MIFLLALALATATSAAVTGCGAGSRLANYARWGWPSPWRSPAHPTCSWRPPSSSTCPRGSHYARRSCWSPYWSKSRSRSPYSSCTRQGDEWVSFSPCTSWRVFPGNVYVAVFDVEVDGQPGGAYPWVRLPLQVLFIAWALWCTREASRPWTSLS